MIMKKIVWGLVVLIICCSAGNLPHLLYHVIICHKQVNSYFLAELTRISADGENAEFSFQFDSFDAAAVYFDFQGNLTSFEYM